MNGMNRNFAAWTASAAAALCLTLGAASGGPAPAPPPSLSPAVPDDPARVALAREFIQLYHPRIDMKHVVEIIDSGMPRAVEAAKHRDPKMDVKKFEQDTRAKMLAAAEKSLDKQSHVVSRHFTGQELKDLIVFFKSPLGRKLATETTNIQREMLMLNRAERTARMNATPVVDPPAKTPAKPHK